MSLYHRRSGSGPALLSVHGIGATLAFWDDVVAQLAPAYTCVRVDVPGFGGSPAEDGAPSVAGLAATLDEWLAGAGLDRVVVLGHSLGGMIAQELALADPDRVRGAVLCNTIPGATDHVAAINTALAAIAEHEGSAALAEAMVPGMLGPDELEGTSRARARFLDDFGASSPAALAGALRAVIGFDARDRLPRLRDRAMPVVVVAGEHEGNDADQRELAARAGARFVVLPGTGHLAPAEAPSAFVAEIRPFLEACTKGTSWR